MASNIIDFFKGLPSLPSFGGFSSILGSSSDQSPSVTNVTGSVQGFDVGNIRAVVEALDFQFWVPDADLAFLATGDQYFNNVSLGFGDSAFGAATITSIVDPAGYATIEVHLDQIEVSQVPEPITLSLFGAGLAGAVAIRRRKTKLA
jgi:hypothetical protein